MSYGILHIPTGLLVSIDESDIGNQRCDVVFLPISKWVTTRRLIVRSFSYIKEADDFLYNKRVLGFLYDDIFRQTENCTHLSIEQQKQFLTEFEIIEMKNAENV